MSGWRDANTVPCKSGEFRKENTSWHEVGYPAIHGLTAPRVSYS
jgi:hypothetical protein